MWDADLIKRKKQLLEACDRDEIRIKNLIEEAREKVSEAYTLSWNLWNQSEGNRKTWISTTRLGQEARELSAIKEGVTFSICSIRGDTRLELSNQ